MKTTLLEEAIANFDKVLEINPNDPDVWCSRGKALQELGRTEEAIANFKKAIEVKPDYHTAWSYPLNKSVTVELHSDRGINYAELRNLLAQGKWEEADRETGKVMLQAANQVKRGWLDEEDIEDFPCEDLRTINQLWLHYSNGKFGFSVQTEIYRSLDETKQYFELRIWRMFGDRVGWRKGGEWMSYDSLQFNLSAPPGHLPRVEGCGRAKWVWKGEVMDEGGCGLDGNYWVGNAPGNVRWLNSGRECLAQRLVRCRI
jgi:tetratricopeptide (TPR) repeat protein